MHAPLAFLGAAGIALFSALSFAELSSRYPRAGGEAVYVREGFGRPDLQVVVGLLVVAAGLISAATVSVGFVGYLSEFVEVPRAVAALGVVAAIGIVVAWGVQESVVAAGLMTILEVGGLFLVVGYGAPHLADLPARAAEMFVPDAGAVRGIGAAAVIAFYAFLGFEDMVNAAEEVKHVRRTLPVAILVTLAVTAALYVLVASVAVLAVPPAELAASDAPLAVVFGRAGGPVRLLGVIAMFALLNGALVQVLKGSRVLWGMADQGVLPGVLRKIHPRTRTPVVTVGISIALTGVLAVAFDLETLAEATSLITLSSFALANLALVRVKRREPVAEGAVHFPIFVPVLGFALSCGLIVLDLFHRVHTPSVG
jgi:amino acid transporter